MDCKAYVHLAACVLCLAIIMCKSQELRKPRIAASMLAYADGANVNMSLTSLAASDFRLYDPVVYVWRNQFDTPADLFLRQFTALRLVLMGFGGNLQIVIPRMLIMGKVLEGDYDWMLEMHDDMCFPPVWFEALLRHDTPSTGVLMPFILSYPVPNNYTPWNVVQDSKDYLENTTWTNCIPVHPWLLKLSAVKRVGYYDERFTPQTCEDHDFYYRLIKGGYTAVNVKLSWVYHHLRKTRRDTHENEQSKIALWEHKHGASWAYFLMDELGCSPELRSRGQPGDARFRGRSDPT